MKQSIYTASIIGLGRIAFSLGFDRLREQPASHTMALLDSRRVRIVSGCDTDGEKCAKWQKYVEKEQHSTVKVYQDAREMLSSNKSDIVVVAVNESAHLDMATVAIEACPRIVILEKPVALSSIEGKRIADIAMKYGVPVMVNHERRFARDWCFARDYIADGHIGQVQSVMAQLCSSLLVYSPVEKNTGAYSLIHDGTHLVDITRFILGNAELTNPLLVNLTRDENDSNVVRNLSVHFEAIDGAIPCPDVLIKISGRSRFFHFGVDVLGTEGRVQLGNGFAQFERREQSNMYTGFYSLAPDNSVSRIVRLLRRTRYFANMVQSAIDFLDGNAPLTSALQDGLDDLEVLEAMRAFCEPHPSVQQCGSA